MLHPTPGAVLVAAALALATVVPAPATTLEQTFVFDENDLAISEVQGYHVVNLRGCETISALGEPALPVRLATVALPPGAEVASVSVTRSESRDLLGRYRPLPAQHPRILPVPGIAIPSPAFVEPRSAVYERQEPYPARLAEVASVGRLGANVVAGIAIHPVQYLPGAGRLRFFSTIVVSVDYTVGEGAELLTGRRAYSDALSCVVENSEAVVRAAARMPREGRPLLEADDFEYVIITSTELVDDFQPLADWKTKKGVPATVVTTEWIESTFPGADLAERIRGFILEARQEWGILWVLLGGDADVVPARHAFAMSSEAFAHPDEDAIAADLYYADLDGDWNADGDGTYGETTDAVDLYPDVFVGRAPVEDVVQAQTFVSKVVGYESSPESGFQVDMLMAAEILWTSPYTDSGIGLNLIDRESVPPRYDPITKLYQSLGNESPSSVIAALNDGPSHFLHDGHAWYTVMGCGTGYIDRNDAGSLTNGSRLPVVYSIGCWPAAFDLDEACIAESFLRNPLGGAVAFVGNNRYGWGAPGNPGYGYSDRFMQRFYDILFNQETQKVGAALAAAKAYYAPLSLSENVYRWHQYEVNLLGDPEMRVWTAAPVELAVTHADSLVAGSSVFDVSVRAPQGPVQGALVCLMNGGDLYARGITGHDGTISLPAVTSTPDSLDITVTAPNALPYEERVPVKVTGVYLRVSDESTGDIVGGNGDGLPGPGETVSLSVTLRNEGDTTAENVEADLSTSDPWVTVMAPHAQYGSLEGGDISQSSPAYELSVAEGCPDRHVAFLDLDVSAGGVRQVWNRAIALTVAAPDISITGYAVDDGLADGDGIAEAGESVRVMLDVANGGLAAAGDPEVQCWTFDPHVAVTSGSATTADIPSDGLRRAVFDLDIAPACPVPHFPELVVETYAAGGYVTTDTVTISVGIAGFADDFEDGAPGWSHAGAPDAWDLTTYRAHSRDVSWYCGSASSHQYESNMSSELLSPQFVLGAGTELSFWCWYDVAIYGVDGIYVELLTDGGAIDTLDFIGSGGALGTLGTIGNDWLEYSYGLEGDPKDTVQVRFRFVSDGEDVGEGFYIDDVVVGTTILPTDTGVPEEGAATDALIDLRQNAPNPFSGSTSIHYSLRAPADVTLTVYNIQGRLIRTLLSGPEGSGEHVIAWDGRDEFGAPVAAGVYLYRLAAGEEEETRKMIFVR